MSSVAVMIINSPVTGPTETSSINVTTGVVLSTIYPTSAIVVTLPAISLPAITRSPSSRMVIVHVMSVNVCCIHEKPVYVAVVLGSTYTPVI